MGKIYKSIAVDRSKPLMEQNKSMPDNLFDPWLLKNNGTPKIKLRPSLEELVAILRKKGGAKKLVENCNPDYLARVVQQGVLKANLPEKSKIAQENHEELENSPEVKNADPRRGNLARSFYKKQL